MLEGNMLIGMNISITNQMINFSISILKEIRDIQMGNVHFIWDIRITHVIFWITMMSEIHFNFFPFFFYRGLVYVY